MRNVPFFLVSTANGKIRYGLLVMLALLTTAMGCSDDAGTYPVRGTVTYEGKPLQRGTVLFNPVDTSQRPARAAIQPDGTYQLQAPPGEHKIAVNLYTETDPNLEPGDPGYKPSESLIPEKYSSVTRTPLKGTVNTQETVIDLDL